MKPVLISLILILDISLAWGQARVLSDEDYNKSGAIRLVFTDSVEVAKELAVIDLNNDTPFLFIQSGLAPIVYPTDSIFESTYKVYYYEQGCTAPDAKLMSMYNQEIFEYLDKEYGRIWRRSIRKDVIGFKKWRRRN